MPGYTRTSVQNSLYSVCDWLLPHMGQMWGNTFISRAWCKPIVTSYIKWGSYNSFAPSPRYIDWLCETTTTHGVEVTDYFLQGKERHLYPDWLCEITTTHGVDWQLERTPAWVEIVLHHLEVKNGFSNAIFNTGYNVILLR